MWLDKLPAVTPGDGEWLHAGSVRGRFRMSHEQMTEFIDCSALTAAHSSRYGNRDSFFVFIPRRALSATSPVELAAILRGIIPVDFSEGSMWRSLGWLFVKGWQARETNLLFYSRIVPTRTTETNRREVWIEEGTDLEELRKASAFVFFARRPELPAEPVDDAEGR